MQRECNNETYKVLQKILITHKKKIKKERKKIILQFTKKKKIYNKIKQIKSYIQHVVQIITEC